MTELSAGDSIRIRLTDCVRLRWLLIDLLLGPLFLAMIAGLFAVTSSQPLVASDYFEFSVLLLLFGLPVIVHRLARGIELRVSHDSITVAAPVGGFALSFSSIIRLAVYQGLRDRGASGVYTVEARDGAAGRFVVRRPDWNNPAVREALERVETQTGLAWQGRGAEQGRGLAAMFRDFGSALWRGSKASSRPQFVLWILRSCVTVRAELAGIGGGAFRLGTAIISISLACLPFLALNPTFSDISTGFTSGVTDGFEGKQADRKLSDRLKSAGDQLDQQAAALERAAAAKRTASDYAAALLAWFSICLGTNVLFTLIREQVRSRESLESELAAARDVQNRLLPQSTPKVPSFELSGACIPAYEVGGDYYDFFPLPGDRLAIAVADVSGKGLGAAMLMTLTKGHLTTSLDHGADVGASLRHLNGRVREGSSENRFISMVVAQIDPRSREISIVRAGHNYPLLLDAASGGTRWVQPPGMALGLASPAMFDKVCRSETFTVAPGDVLVLYTDGVTEAMNGASEEYGEERLSGVVCASAAGSADAIRDAVLADVRAFRAGAPANDDLTLVVLRAV